jgi:hypothetical protein
MTCTEFQKVLPFIIDTGGSAEEEAHLKSCPVCTDLVADLKYIAEQAKLLVPMVEPSPKVWDGIEASLEREGLVRPSGTARFPSPIAVVPARWSPSYGLVALAALLLIAIGLVTYHARKPAGNEAAMQPAAPAAASVLAVDGDDAQLLQEIAQRDPSQRAAYEDSLRSVNSYIADAQKALAEHPESQEAHDHLMYANQQKAMLYGMAVSSSLQ